MVENWDQHAEFKLVHRDTATEFAADVTGAYRQGFRLWGDGQPLVAPLREGGLAHWHVLMVRYQQKEER